MTTDNRDHPHELYALAHRFQTFADHLPSPADTSGLPSLGDAALLLGKFSDLISETADMVLFGTEDPKPLSTEHRRTTRAMTSAAARASEALVPLSTALEALGTVNELAALDDSPAHNASAAARATALYQLRVTRRLLNAPVAALRREADHLTDQRTDQRTTAADPASRGRATAARHRGGTPPPAAPAPQPSTPPNEATPPRHRR